MNTEIFSDPIILRNIGFFSGLLLTVAGGIFDLGKIDDNVDMVVEGVTNGLWNEEGIPQDESLRNGIEDHVLPDIFRRQRHNVTLSLGSAVTAIATGHPIEGLAVGINTGTVINSLLYFFKSSSISRRFPSVENIAE